MTLWPMMLHHRTKSGYRRSAAEEISSRWTFTGILNFFCDLDLDHNRAIHSFRKTITLMMMNHQTKFSCQRISGADNVSKSHILIILSLTVTLTLKTANQSFWKTIWLIMLHQHTKFGSKRLSVPEDTIWTNIHWNFEILMWPWPRTQQSNFSIKHSGLWYDNVLSNQVWWQTDEQFKRYSRNCHILIIWALAVTLTLKKANQSVCMTLCLIMMQHNTKFENKMFGGLEVIIWTNINILTFAVTLTLNAVT